MKPPIFIVGPPRSGTTLLSKILTEHPDIHITIETHFFEEVLPGLREGDFNSNDLAGKLIDTHSSHLSPEQRRVELQNTNPEELAEALETTESTPRELLDSYLEYHARIRSKKRAGEKTPRHVFHLNTLRSLYPEAPVLLCVRDGRDFLASYKKKHAPTADTDDGGIYHPVITSMLWRGSIKALLEFKQNDPRNLLVPYEQLVRSPESTIREICEFLDEPFHGTMLNPESDNTSYENDTGDSDGIYTSSIGQWEEQLEASEIAIFDCINGSLMDDLGYDRKPVNYSLFRSLPHVLSLPVSLPLAVWNNRDNIPLSPGYFLRRLKKMLS